MAVVDAFGGAELNCSQIEAGRCADPARLGTRCGRRLLRCGISIRPLSALGHSQPMRSKPREYACPQADRRAEVWPSPLSAISDLMHCKKGRQALASDSLLKINLTRQVVAPPNRQPLG